MNTRQTIERWVEQFNAGDAAALSGLYAEDAVNHQIALQRGYWDSAQLNAIHPDVH